MHEATKFLLNNVRKVYCNRSARIIFNWNRYVERVWQAMYLTPADIDAVALEIMNIRHDLDSDEFDQAFSSIQNILRQRH
tara:strand:+ start:162 stop:401 length:240 start_codon:yes stop_codon:yes gene_type:complete